MSNDDLSAKEHITDVFAMGQEPKDRLWAAIAVLIVIALLSGLITVVYSETTRGFLESTRDLGFERGAVDCLQVVVDNDRFFDLPNYCNRPEVVVYYPPAVCDAFFPDVVSCGDRWYEE